MTTFEADCAARWEGLVANLPTDAPPRLPAGHYDITFAVLGLVSPLSLRDLRELIAREVRNYSGWPAFVTIERRPYTPRAIDGLIETWIGPDDDGSYDSPAHHDFWRMRPDGMMFTRRGYPEDGRVRNVSPGTTFDITTPTWRLGEAVLAAAAMAKAMGAETADLAIHCRWTGLAGRTLVSVGNSRRWVHNHRQIHQDVYEARQTVAVAAITDGLPEIVERILAPLYEMFDFFALPETLVTEELNELRRNRF